MTQVAITVIGHDRPGIIAETTGLLAGLGANLEDSSMTILRGHFAMVLLASVKAAVPAVEEALSPLVADGTLAVSVREVPEEAAAVPSVGPAFLLSVHGADRPGIVSAVTAQVAAVGGNVTDLTTRLTGDLYVLLAEVDLPEPVDVTALDEQLTAVGRDLGVQVSLRPLEPDVL